jgi:hypothetical protein
MPTHVEHLSWWTRFRNALPEGRTLPDKVWHRRHRALLTLLWLHVAGLTIFALAQGMPVLHSFQEAGSSRQSPSPPLSPATASARPPRSCRSA